MRWGFLAMYLSCVCWLEIQRTCWPPKCSLCIACPQRMDGHSWQRLDAALLSAQGVAPVICWNCCERPLATSSDRRSRSGQVVLSPPSTAQGSTKTAVSRNLEEGCPWCFAQIPAPRYSLSWCAASEMIPFITKALPRSLEGALSTGHGLGLAASFGEESWVLTTSRIPNWVSQTHGLTPTSN